MVSCELIVRWPNLIDKAMANSGWPYSENDNEPYVLKSIEVPKILLALTGIAPKTLFDAGSGGSEVDPFVDPGKMPTVLQTGATTTVLKPNYAYSIEKVTETQ